MNTAIEMLKRKCEHLEIWIVHSLHKWKMTIVIFVVKRMKTIQWFDLENKIYLTPYISIHIRETKWGKQWMFSRIYRKLFTLQWLIMYRVFIKYCVFSKNFQYFATSPSQGPGCYWLYRKWPANKGDCTLSSQIRRVDLLQAEDGLQ